MNAKPKKTDCHEQPRRHSARQDYVFKQLSVRARYILVVFGIVGFLAWKASLPHGEFSLFPSGAIYLVALAVPTSLLLLGMFSGDKGREAIGPLMLAILSLGALLVLHRYGVA